MRMGGTHPVWSGAHPRRPQTPFRAFLAEKLQALEHFDPSVKLMSRAPLFLMLTFQSASCRMATHPC